MPSAVSKTTVRLVPLKHKARADGTCPIAVRVTADRKSRYQTTGIRVRPQEWNPNRDEVRASHDLADAYNAKLKTILNDARQLALHRTSADAVKSALAGGASLSSYFGRFIDGLDAADQYWERKKYRCTFGKLKSALGSDEIAWGDLDLVALGRFERHMRVTRKNAPNTVRKELTRLHRVVKQAVRDGEIEPAGDPFLVYEMPAKAKVNRRKLSADEVAQIRDLDAADGVADGSIEAIARDAFCFAFYSAGARFGDVANLKAADVNGGSVNYRMLKTNTAVSIPLPPPALAIASRYGDGAGDRGGFLFPMLTTGDDCDGVTLRRRIGSWNAKVNLALKTLAKKAELPPGGLSFHIARHSYADHARRQSGDLHAISGALGHSSLATTELYLASFDRDAVDELSKTIW